MKKAQQRERQKLHEMTGAAGLRKSVPRLVPELNRHLRGWANYFAFGLNGGVPGDGGFLRSGALRIACGDSFGEPDAGNPHVRFDEGAARRASESRVALLYSTSEMARVRVVDRHNRLLHSYSLLDLQLKAG